MRDFIHIGGLFLVFAFLVSRYPSTMPSVAVFMRPASAFASFVTLSPAAHAARLEAARTSWQVRSMARGRPLVGRLDSAIPLLDDALPPPSADAFSALPMANDVLPPPDVETYSFVPPTMGAEMPEFAIGTHKADTDNGRPAASTPSAFDMKAMLDTEDYKSLKEIMK